MNRIESFALQGGLQIDHPFIEENFFPISNPQYITVNCCGEVAGKQYNLLQDVVDLISPYLEKNNISIYQLGYKKNNPLQKCNVLVNSTSINQAAFILSRSMLHFGVDGALNHIASHFNTPVVALYSGLPPSACAPYFNADDNLVNITGTEEGKGPTYNEDEPNRTINNIKPEIVAENILKLLEIQNDLKSIKTLRVGNLYHMPILECVPDFSPGPEFFPKSLINLRLDYHFDPKQILNFSNGRRLGIITNKALEPKYILPSKKNIESITYKVGTDSDESFVQEISNLGLKVNILTSDKDNLKDIRVKFIDWKVNYFKLNSKKDIDKHGEICDNTFFKTKKVLISKDGQFLSKAHWKQKSCPPSQDHSKIINHSDFWEESEHFLIYNKTDAGKKKK